MTNTAALLVRAADARLLDGDPGGTITLLLDGPDTGGALSTHRSTFRDGFDGAPPHVHHETTELFVVLAGALQVLLDDQLHIVHAGDALVVPPGVVHAFAAAPGHDAEVLCVLTPGRARSAYYELLERVHTGAARPAEIAATQDRFDNHYAESALWCDRPRGAQAVMSR